jgi:hypothetical protein
MKSVLMICYVNFAANSCLAQSNISTGTLIGRVNDSETKMPLPGASVILPGNGLGASAGSDGKFLIANIPIGSYSVQFRYLGYEMTTQTDVIVRPRRATVIEAELKPSSIQMEQVVVSGGYFRHDDLQPLSTTAFSREEIRRAPGSGGDVSRIILGLPSLAKVNDQSNNLIVRGGSPLENAFYIDNIEVPNINHFPTQGASGGPIGMINVDLIRDVSFRAGGFGASYGDRLSSIMELTLREGNRTETDGQLSLDFIGFGGVVEGPLFRGKGSYLLSIRRSYLDLIVQSRLFDIGTGVIPRYGDFQGKLVYDITPNHSLELVSLVGNDHNTPDRATAQEYDMTHFGNQDVVQTTVGLNWRALWSEHMYSNTSLSYTSSAFDEDFYETNTGALFVRNHSVERAWKIRNVNHVKISDKHSLEFGLDAARLMNDYNNVFGAYTDAIGNSVPEFAFTKKLGPAKAGLFAVYSVKPIEKLTATIGLRGDYFSLSKRSSISPRFALSYRIDELTSLNVSGGVYHQDLPAVLLAQNPVWYSLGTLEAVQYVIGAERLLTEDAKLTIEAYQKTYDRFPLDPADPALFLIDEQQYRFGYFEEHGSLTSTGKAESQGIEAMVQKKLARNVYGLASATYFRARYRGGDGVWRNRIYDNRFIVSVEGGYKPNGEWEFSARWIYAGGPPYTPFDTVKSRAAGRGVLGEDRINQARYPDYHSLNVRFDKRFHFARSNLVFYLSIWNVYNRKNVAYYFWNAEKNDIGTVYQWSILPVFGLEYEF